jgi:protein gp37
VTGVAFCFKQWGGIFKKRTGRELEGGEWNEMPASLPTIWPLRQVEQRL